MVLISLRSCSAKASIAHADADSSATADDRQPGPGRSSRHGGASDNDDCATGGGCAEQVRRAARRAGSLSTPKVSGTAGLLCSDLITAQCRRRGRQFTESYGEFGAVCPRWQKTSVRPRASQWRCRLVPYLFSTNLHASTESVGVRRFADLASPLTRRLRHTRIPTAGSCRIGNALNQTMKSVNHRWLFTCR